MFNTTQEYNSVKQTWEMLSFLKTKFPRSRVFNRVNYVQVCGRPRRLSSREIRSRLANDSRHVFLKKYFSPNWKELFPLCFCTVFPSLPLSLSLSLFRFNELRLFLFPSPFIGFIPVPVISEYKKKKLDLVDSRRHRSPKVIGPARWTRRSILHWIIRVTVDR